MAQDGDYPFLVYVWNRFQQEGINLKVSFSHHAYGRQEDNIKNNDYKIYPGDMVGFPLFWHDESLIISIDQENNPTLPETYYIWSGPKVNYTPEPSNLSQLVQEYIPCGTGGVHSGIYKIKSNNPSTWTLTVQKLLPDPETTNVSVGEDIP